MENTISWELVAHVPRGRSGPTLACYTGFGKPHPFPMTQFPCTMRKLGRSLDPLLFAAIMGFLLRSYLEQILLTPVMDKINSDF